MILFVSTTIGYILIVLIRSIVLQYFVLFATTNMHEMMSWKVLRAKILFFDSNPSGRITTRFSKDMTLLDIMVPPILMLVTQGMLRAASVVISVAIVNQWILIIALIAIFYMIYVVKTAMSTMVDAQRFDQQFFGPINTSLTTIVNGQVTFRGYRQYQFFRNQFMESIEKSANSTFCYIISNRWIGIRLDFVCIIFGVSTASFAVAFRGKIEKELLTFTLQIITDIIVFFSISIRMFAEVQNAMTSSQRIVQYCKLDQEDELEKPKDKELQKSNWPSKGELTFNNLSMRYREHMDPSINNLDVKIQPGMKVGIVGRTGAGKSSIL